MHFLKTLSALTAVLATLTTAAPVPTGVYYAEVDSSGFVEEVAAPTTADSAPAQPAATMAVSAAAVSAPQTTVQPLSTSAPQSQASSSQQQIPTGQLSIQQGKGVDVPVATSMASALPMTSAAVSAPAVSSVQSVAQISATSAPSSNAASSQPAGSVMTAEPTPSATFQQSTAVASPTVVSTSVSAPSATVSAMSSPSASMQGSSGSNPSSSGSSGSSSGPGLTIVNKCTSAVQASEYQGEFQTQVGGTQDLAANGGTAFFPMNGPSQVVKVYWSGTNIWEGDNTNAEVEWTVGNGQMPFYDLSFIKGNPFLNFGQSIEAPCTNSFSNTNLISCKAGDNACQGTYFSESAPDAGISCPQLAQQGLTYTLCDA